MMLRKLLLVLLLLPSSLLAAAPAELNDTQLVLQKNDSPLIAFRILFLTGSADDPSGKEGVAALTSSMITDAGTQKNDYRTILQLLFPMAASYSSQIDKEMTVITGVTHKDNLLPYYELLRDAVLTPGFRDDDFGRLKTDQLNYVAKTLRFNDDEELGKAALNWMIFKNHPYGPPIAGLVSSNSGLTLQDVKDFYKTHFTRDRVVVGVAGNYPQSLIARIRKDFGSLPQSDSSSQAKSAKAAMPSIPDGMHVVMIEKQTPATAISFGFPIPITRSDEDFYPLMIFNSWFGQHRSQFSHLYDVMREKRGLNYGDYSYIEHFAFGGRFMQPPPNYARHQQIFEVWIRPVPNPTRHFALREAVHELQMIVDKGMTKEQFDLTRNFLTNFSVNLAQSNLEQLGYALDDKFYGLSQPFLDHMKARFSNMTVEDVNKAIKKYLNARNLQIAIVTQDAASLKADLVSNKPSPIQYDSPKPGPVMEEDKSIMNYPLNIKETDVTIIPASKIFE